MLQRHLRGREDLSLHSSHTLETLGAGRRPREHRYTLIPVEPAIDISRESGTQRLRLQRKSEVQLLQGIAEAV